MVVKVDRLENGIRVVTHQMPHLETASLGVWVNAGSRTEAENEHGISHFLEHMAFKGTDKRSARDVVEGIEAVGGDINAATSLDTTCYFVRVLKDDVLLGLDTLADILQNPLFKAEDIAKEKEVILQEIAESKDSPEDVVHEQANELAYTGQSLGRPILGTGESVSSFDADMLRAYMGRHYTADNMVVSAAGAIDHETFLNDVGSLFAGLPRSGDREEIEARYCGGMKRLDGRFEQSHIVLAFEGVPYTDSDFYTQQVFSSFLGGGMSSRLFQEVREKYGLCYTIYSFSWGMPDTGLMGIHAATTHGDQVPELTKVVINQLKQIANDGPNEAELARAKAQLKAGILMSLESTGSRAEQLARQVLVFNEPVDTEELISRVDRVTVDNVRSLVHRIIANSVPTCSGVGSFGSFSDYEWLKEQFKM